MAYSSEGIGFQNTDTSEAAAQAVAPKVKSLRASVLDVLRRNPAGLDSEQIARLLNVPYQSVQPRTSELRNCGMIFDSGLRNHSRFGRAIAVWRHAAYSSEGGSVQ